MLARIAGMAPIKTRKWLSLEEPNLTIVEVPPKNPPRRVAVSQTLKNADLKARKDAATPRGVGVMCDFYAERAENAELWDVEGRRFIDFAAGIAGCNTGDRPPQNV